MARRYKAMCRAGVLQVVANISPVALGESDWIVRVRTRPDAVLGTAQALARRPDVSWVSVNAGGSEIVCSVRSHTQEEREHLLLDRLPRSAAVLDLTLSVILRRFVGGKATDLVAEPGVLTPEQAEQLAVERQVPRYASIPVVESLDPGDYAMFRVLARDGRAPVGALARAAQVSEGRAGRRLDTLLGSGVVYLHVDLSTTALGYPIAAHLWLTVPPDRLESTCEAIAEHPEALFVAAISGRSNVLAWIACRSLDGLYQYVTERIGLLESVHSVEVSPVLQTLKQSGTHVDGDLLTVHK
ncbi:DNA-binding transcriptional regulator, Lrp family [Lentzea jiangxiensis]|uniref:DNA-binding transcriptional regulator, Lrp family n=1 Tax=Lentzea jiangxiensis TaxID=641025 RepID=A0A1H0WYD9_9PSEU|nr:DNA-binding transcriptional regulator, Lrp family [Lentzea jiangxiensis]